jgi:DNA-directed RNA polymerase specialized sigma24 family protein
MAARRKFDQVVIKDTLTEEEIFVRKALEEVYPQLLLNMYKVCGEGYEKWGDDLLPVAIEYFLRYDLDKQIETIKNGKLENFITFIANRQLKSGATHYYNYYRKFSESMRMMTDKLVPIADSNDVNTEEEVVLEQQQHSDAIECMMEFKNTLDPFKKMLVEKVFLEGLTLRTISRRYKINYYALKAELPVVKQMLRDHCQHCFND